MKRALLVVALVAIVGLAGCSALGGDSQPGVEEGIDIEDNSTDASNISHSMGIEVTDESAGDELTAVGATYPREHFVVDSAQHDQIVVSVDTNGDGEPDREFDASHVSGVNNNAFSFDITLDTDYTLQSGDVVFIEYPAIDNPSEPGEYTVELRLNDGQTANATAVIE